ncbi:hypothetical protein GCM10009677_15000 [Sphaerisporangium rubeum]|uniref:Cell wall-associated NlpC family hydrolase n=1 Tax=Sphaerisporangium rubeum TaxID=321317 RepID=A0A7X0IBI2_9ACTN|nr:NlpC/P60 family protein [Sphaerisporangium rubeum]MBB6472170.1 cell wall-associated NlpC family hydrolase [Sphaerisporangium rubeum]
MFPALLTATLLTLLTLPVPPPTTPSGPAAHPRNATPTRLPEPVTTTPRPATVTHLPAPPTLLRAVRKLRRTPGAVAAGAALRQLGTPYIWGGGSRSGPTRGGFDCSGLALYAWSRAGVTLPHYTGTQFRRGHRIPFPHLRQGDLVFFGGGTTDPTHVGIYLNHGTMIHAPRSGDVVRRTPFATSPYYRLRYRGATRPHP